MKIEETRMIRRFVLGVGVCALVSVLFATCVQAQQPSFAVASIHQSGQEVKFERDGKTDTSPGHLLMKDVTVQTCVKWAYGMQRSQVIGPAWIESEHFDIDAKSDDPVDVPQLKLMLQTLLADRFKLTFHREKKELKGFVMTVSKSGLKMRPSPTDVAHSWQNSANGTVATGIPIQEFTDYIAGPMEAPILNETGLPGKYDFTLDFTSYLPPDMHAMTGEATGILIAALQGELGLKLEGRRTMFDVMVIDHVEKPTDN
jgi:uncharacterized protein (TIGR03435 family)